MRTLCSLVACLSILSRVAGIHPPTYEPKQLRVPQGSPARQRLERVPRSAWISERLEPAQASQVPPGRTDAAPVVPERREQMSFGRDSVTYFCVAVLTIQCMLIHTALSVARNSDVLSGETEPSLLTQTLSIAARGIVYAPMMCMLFVACRLFVLDASEGSGEPQLWVKICMVAASFGMTLQFFIVLILPMFTAQWSEKGPELAMRLEELAGEPTDVHVQMEAIRFCDDEHRATFEALQVLAVAFIYCGIGGVIAGIFTFPRETHVSPSILCTVFLTVLYFTIYFLLWLSDLLGMQAYSLRAAARQALMPIRKAPMISVLFLASRMRALQLNPPHGMPSQFEQLSFVVISLALFLETSVAFYIGATGEEQTGPRCSHSMPSYKSSDFAQTCLHFFGLVVYCGMVPVVYGMLMMRGELEFLPRALSSTCAVVLQFAAMYFAVHVLQWLFFMVHDKGSDFPNARAVVLSADVSVRLCPLISVLCVACRLRALQISHQLGEPQPWAQQAMFMSVFAMLVQTLSCLVLPIAMGSAAPIDGDGCAEWDMKPLLVAYVVTVMKYIALFCLHGGALMITLAIFTMTPHSIESHTGLLEGDTLKYCFLVSIVSFGFALFFSMAKVLGIIFKLAVEGFDKDLLGVEITVRMAAMSLLRGWINIADVVVDNPRFPAEGGSTTWSAPHLLKVKRVHADLDMVKLATSGGKVFEFENIILQDVDINYDKPWRLRDNVSCILDHIKNLQDHQPKPGRAIPMPTRKPPLEETAAHNSGVNVVFHKIKIEGVHAQVYVSGPAGLGGQMNVALTDLDYPDFAQQCDPNDPQQVQQEVLLFIIRSLMETVAANVGPGKNLKAATQAAKGVTNAVQKYSNVLKNMNPCNSCQTGVSRPALAN